MLKTYLKQFSSDPAVRQKAYRKIAHDVCAKGELKLYKSHLIWLTDPEFLQVRKAWGEVVSIPDDRCFFLYNAVKNVRQVAGDTVDIGVRFGASSFYILKSLNDPARRHLLFDSFEGLSEPVGEDAIAGGESFWKKGDMSVDEQACRKNLSMFPNCEFFKGWIPERFAEVKDRVFSFVHIDVDLYQPTLDSLEFFYNRVSPGGIILSDDYGSGYCPGAKKAFDDFFAGKKQHLFHIPTGQAMVVKL